MARKQHSFSLTITMNCHRELLGTFILIFSSVFAIATDVNDVSMKRDFQQLCPYTDFCHLNASKVIRNKHQTPCCLPCSCEDDCWSYGTCCTEKQAANARDTEALIQECKSSVVKQSVSAWTTSYNGISKGIRRYRVVTQCPKTEKNETLKLNCNGTTGQMLKNLVWVTDRKTNQIFNNEFCAQCHGVKSFEQWNLGTNCRDLLISDSYSQGAIAMHDFCTMFVTPPNSKASTHLCYLPDITECNVTGRWKNYDSVMEQLCDEYRLYYYDQPFRTLYSNVFCYLCNEASGAIVNEMCSALQTSRSFTSFSAILDLSIFATEENMKQLGRCGVNEIEDPLKLGCFYLCCPPLRFPWYGTCRKRSKKIYFLGIEVKYMLYPIWDKIRYGYNDQSDYSINSLAEVILRKVHKELGLTKVGCGRCRDFIKVFNVDKKVGKTSLPLFVSLDLSFYTNAKCDPDTIIDAASKTGKEMIIKRGAGEYITFDVHETDDTDEFQKNTTDIDIHQHTAFCEVREFANYMDFRKCPTVILEGAVYDTLMTRADTASKKNLVEKIFGFNNNPVNSTTTRNMTVHVCFEDYKKAVTQLTSSSKKLLLDTIIVLVATAALVLSLQENKLGRSL